MEWLSFKKEEEANALLSWFRSMSKRRKAELMRASSFQDISQTEAYVSLMLSLRNVTDKVSKEKVKSIVFVMRFVREHSAKQTLAQGMHQHIHESHFRRLLAQEGDLETLSVLMSRIVKQLSNYGPVNVLDLANSMYWWNETTKEKWAFDFYSLGESK